MLGHISQHMGVDRRAFDAYSKQLTVIISQYGSISGSIAYSVNIAMVLQVNSHHFKQSNALVAKS